jgi:hypothetical protein
VKDRKLWQTAWRAAHAVGAAGLLALAAMLFLSLPARADAPASPLVAPVIGTADIQFPGGSDP